MAVLQKILDVLPLNEEQRRFQRVRVNLLGRYMLADRREFPCQVIDMSPGGMAVVAPGQRQARRTRDRLCRSCRPARRHDRPRHCRTALR